MAISSKLGTESAQHAPAPLVGAKDQSQAQGKPEPEALRSARWERKLGDSEVSYFLPSREGGVNDMYLHLAFSAPPHHLRRERVAAVWALMRLRHPLLAASVEMRDYDDINFVRIPPPSAAAALAEAQSNLEYRTQSRYELIDSYLNGPRTLSSERISRLIVSSDAAGEYQLMLCALHMIGDGMTNSNTMNDMFYLLASEKTQEKLEALVADEWEARCGAISSGASHLPMNLEARLPDSSGKFQDAAGKIDFERHCLNDIGGHSFTRESGKPRRHTVVHNASFDESRTKVMLKSCKAHGVSISAAVYAACNIAWARCGGSKPELPMLIYSAINLRPFLAPPSPRDSMFYFACGYFNIILPTFLPSSPEGQSRTFWHRSQLCKAQSAAAVKSPFIVTRTREMARMRSARARTWGREDDEKAKGIWVPPPPAPAPAPAVGTSAKVPNIALLGVSHLGNLDGIYKHAEWPAFKMREFTTGARQRSGGMLMFGYTFGGKMYVSFAYDDAGVKKAQVEEFWSEVLKVLEEYVVV